MVSFPFCGCLRQAKRQQLEAERARREEEDAAAAAQRSAEAAKDRLLQEEAQRLLAEQQRKDQEEYNAAKSTFVTEAEGSRAEELERESQTLLQQFVEYITMHKVVALEQLAAHFELRTQDAIDRLAQLQHMGRITGVTDDRGKFIYITPQVRVCMYICVCVSLCVSVCMVVCTRFNTITCVRLHVCLITQNIFLSLCACVRVCVRVCVRACVRACVRCVCVCVCV